MASDPISQRQRHILMALCRLYVLGGRPVASAALCRAGLEWSSATIRGELATLERIGLVHKPHAASGRVPSAEGWRIYVEALPRQDARPEHQRLVDVSLNRSDPRLGLRSTARVLSEISGCVAIGFLGEARPGVVRALELVPLATAEQGSSRVLVMLGLEDGGSSVRTVSVDRELFSREGELRRLQELLRELTLGRSLAQARAQLREAIDTQEQRVDRLVAEALRIGMLLCVASFDPLWMQVAGHGSLFSSEVGSEDQPIGEVLAVLEDYQRVAEILCQLLPEVEDDPRASVRVDLALAQLGHPLGATDSVTGPMLHVVSEREREQRASGLTLVGCRLGWPGSRRRGQPTGAVALLGSPRMDYEAVIPLVEYAARAMAARD